MFIVPRVIMAIYKVYGLRWGALKIVHYNIKTSLLDNLVAFNSEISDLAA